MFMSVLDYEVLGEENGLSPLLVIHTTPLDRSYLHNSLKMVPIRGQIILIDLPSHGLSADIPEEYLDFEHMAEYIDKLRIKLNTDKISILGHGIGGIVALFYLINHEKHLDHLILVNTAGDNRYRRTMAWNIREKYSKVTIQALDEYYGKTDDKSVKVRFTQALATYFNPIDHEKANDLLDNCSRIATDTYVYISRAVLPDYNVRELIRNTSRPTLIIVSRDDVWPPESSTLLRNDLPHAKFQEFDGGHFVMLEHPDEFWARVFNFLYEK